MSAAILSQTQQCRRNNAITPTLSYEPIVAAAPKRRLTTGPELVDSLSRVIRKTPARLFVYDL